MDTHAQWQQLARDTLAFAKQEIPPSPVKPKQQNIPKPIPPKPIPSPPKQKSDLFEKMRSQLPGIALVTPLPTDIGDVLIPVFDPDELPFLKALAKAIRENFCCVKLLDATKYSKEVEWTLLLKGKRTRLLVTQKEPSQETANAYPHIHISAGHYYRENPSEKKLLWRELCQRLSSP